MEATYWKPFTAYREKGDSVWLTLVPSSKLRFHIRPYMFREHILWNLKGLQKIHKIIKKVLDNIVGEIIKFKSCDSYIRRVGNHLYCYNKL